MAVLGQVERRAGTLKQEFPAERQVSATDRMAATFGPGLRAADVNPVLPAMDLFP
jgi:hypothetical protein